MPNPQISRLRMLGLLFTLLGGTLIVLGWNGMAKYACVDCQMPFLLSGGFAGLGLIVIGVGLLVLAQIRVEGDKIAQQLTAASSPADDSADTTAAIPGQREVKHTEPVPVGARETSASSEATSLEAAEPAKPGSADTMIDGLRPIDR
ncbi:MAG: hypothetical protein GEU94_13970 [Micromonosporaceae bacterium]|nr:hypothetical protein [Micromonosporaceae bacterium]